MIEVQDRITRSLQSAQQSDERSLSFSLTFTTVVFSIPPELRDGSVPEQFPLYYFDKGRSMQVIVRRDVLLEPQTRCCIRAESFCAWSGNVKRLSRIGMVTRRSGLYLQILLWDQNHGKPLVLISHQDSKMDLWENWQLTSKQKEALFLFTSRWRESETHCKQEPCSPPSKSSPLDHY